MDSCVSDWPKGPNIVPRPNLGSDFISSQWGLKFINWVQDELSIDASIF